MDLTAIRKGIAANAATATGLEDAKHYRPDTATSSTVFWVEVDTVALSTISGGDRMVTLEGTLITQGPWDRSKQQKTDELTDAVWSAIESDKTLGGAAHVTQVRQAVVLRDPEDGASYGVRFDIEVEA